MGQWSWKGKLFPAHLTITPLHAFRISPVPIPRLQLFDFPLSCANSVVLSCDVYRTECLSRYSGGIREGLWMSCVFLHIRMWKYSSLTLWIGMMLNVFKKNKNKKPVLDILFSRNVHFLIKQLYCTGAIMCFVSVCVSSYIVYVYLSVHACACLHEGVNEVLKMPGLMRDLKPKNTTKHILYT